MSAHVIGPRLDAHLFELKCMQFNHAILLSCWEKRLNRLLFCGGGENWNRIPKIFSFLNPSFRWLLANLIHHFIVWSMYFQPLILDSYWFLFL